jgi:hypothetical protein
MTLFNPTKNEKEFAEKIIKNYYARSVIKKLVNIKEFDPPSNICGKFIQITYGLKMGRSEFNDKIDNDLLAQEIGSQVAFGEINYLTSRLKESYEPNFESNVLLKFTDLKKELKQLLPEFEPKALLIPMQEELFTAFGREFSDKGFVEYTRGNTILHILGYNINVYWSTKMSSNEIYLIGENAVKWFIKTPAQMNRVIDKIRDYVSLDKLDNKLDIFFNLDNNQLSCSGRVVVLASINPQLIRIYKPEFKKDKV